MLFLSGVKHCRGVLDLPIAQEGKITPWPFSSASFECMWKLAVKFSLAGWQTRHLEALWFRCPSNSWGKAVISLAVHNRMMAQIGAMRS